MNDRKLKILACPIFIKNKNSTSISDSAIDISFLDLASLLCDERIHTLLESGSFVGELVNSMSYHSKRLSTYATIDPENVIVKYDKIWLDYNQNIIYSDFTIINDTFINHIYDSDKDKFIGKFVPRCICKGYDTTKHQKIPVRLITVDIKIPNI